jgi:type VI secretion system protein ImpB
LSDLLSKLDGNDKLEELLQEVLDNTESLEKLGKEVGAYSASTDKQE